MRRLSASSSTRQSLLLGVAAGIPVTLQLCCQTFGWGGVMAEGVWDLENKALLQRPPDSVGSSPLILRAESDFIASLCIFYSLHLPFRDTHRLLIPFSFCLQKTPPAGMQRKWEKRNTCTL